MNRNLFATTALAAFFATGAFAQDTTAPAPAPTAPAPMDQVAPVEPATPLPAASGQLASNIIGENVYSGVGDTSQHIGDVNDLVIGENGAIESAIVGVGGFLGIGQKNVALAFSDLDWTERDGDRWLVTPMTKEQLEAQPDFDKSIYEPAPATTATDTTMPPADTTAQAPATLDPAAPAVPDTTAQAPATTDPAAPATTMPDTGTTAAIDRSTLTELPAADIRAEEMVGTTVYGANDENVGEIGDVVLTADGKVDAYIIDVGGFLGVGEKEVAVGSDNLAFMADQNGNRYLYTSLTKEQLDAAPAYDESNWAEQRDQQRIMIR